MYLITNNNSFRILKSRSGKRPKFKETVRRFSSVRCYFSWIWEIIYVILTGEWINCRISRWRSEICLRLTRFCEPLYLVTSWSSIRSRDNYVKRFTYYYPSVLNSPFIVNLPMNISLRKSSTEIISNCVLMPSSPQYLDGKNSYFISFQRISHYSCQLLYECTVSICQLRPPSCPGIGGFLFGVSNETHLTFRKVLKWCRLSHNFRDSSSGIL
jgi:hypothetical protein